MFQSAGLVFWSADVLVRWTRRLCKHNPFWFGLKGEQLESVDLIGVKSAAQRRVPRVDS